MFNSITGTITYKGSSFIYLENNGIEWEITASAKTISMLPIGKTAKVVTHLHFREDNIALYGFYSEKERDVFFELIKVSGIGPKQAIKILSGISVDDFISMLDSENIAQLSGIPGIGQKTAQKIVLSMRGKLLKPQEAVPQQYSDIIKALSDMGFDYKKAAKVVADIAAESGIAALETSEKEKALLKKAIIALSSQAG